MTLDHFNKLSTDEQHQALETCCGAQHWVKQMVAKAPFSSKDQLFYFADYLWDNAHEESWLEAITQHPKFGNNEKGTNTTDQEIHQSLAKGHKTYEDKYGFNFIIHQIELSPSMQLDVLNQRLLNSNDDEIFVAMKEQQKITKMKLDTLIDDDITKRS